MHSLFLSSLKHQPVFPQHCRFTITIRVTLSTTVDNSDGLSELASAGGTIISMFFSSHSIAKNILSTVLIGCFSTKDMQTPPLPPTPPPPTHLVLKDAQHAETKDVMKKSYRDFVL